MWGGRGTGRKIPKKHAFSQSAQISLCINLEPWNFLCLLLLTLSSGKKNQIWISRSYDLQYLGVKIEVRKFETLTFPDRFSCLMAQNDPNRMYMSNSWLDFRIWGHPWCGGRFRGRNCNFSNFVVYDPISLFFISKWSKYKIKESYFTHILGFEATERL